MKIYYGNELASEIRKNADKLVKRIWVCVPFIGGLKSVSSIIGKEWIDNPSISVKLLTDASDFNNFNSETLTTFLHRGKIKHLLGLHAKIYILDNTFFISSANLTNTAFAKRYEVGIKILGNNAKGIEKLFNSWWSKAVDVSSIKINKVVNTKKISKEDVLDLIYQIFGIYQRLLYLVK